MIRPVDRLAGRGLDGNMHAPSPSEAREDSIDARCSTVHSSQSNDNSVRGAVIDKRQPQRLRCDFGAIHGGEDDASFDSRRIFDANLISRRTAPQSEFEAYPRFGDAGIDAKAIALQPHSQDAFQPGALHPGG